MTRMEGPRNVLGTELKDCSHDPLTGFFRDGCCRTGQGDAGVPRGLRPNDGRLPRVLPGGGQ